MGLHVEKPMLKMSAYTTEDSDGNAMLKDHAYQAVNDGWAVAYELDLDGAEDLYIYVGLTDDPRGAGVIIQRCGNQGVSGAAQSVCAWVAKGEYFEVRDIGKTPTIRWKSLGLILQKPIDFN